MIVAISLLLNGAILCYDVLHTGLGVTTHISVRKAGSDRMEFCIRYLLPTGGYSVREVPTDEGEYVGDGMVAYDGTLGKYRILISFGDVEPSTALNIRFAADGTTTLKY